MELVRVSNLSKIKAMRVCSVGFFGTWKRYSIILSLFLLIIFNLIILSNIFFLEKNYKLAFYSYPLNKQIYFSLVNSQIVADNQQASFKYLDYYVKFFNGDSDVLNFAGNVYDEYGEKKQAINFYEKGFNANNFEDPGVIKKVYAIKLNIQGQKEAKEFADKYFLRLSLANNNFNYYQVFYGYRLSAFKICRKIYTVNCPYTF
jgi:tetratricopeptide (TPR) repeat protein